MTGTTDHGRLTTDRLAIIAITPGGAALARRLGEALPHAAVYLPEAFRRADGGRYFAEPVGALLPQLFKTFGGLVCIMATGIVIRTLASSLRNKAVDPAVVVMDEKGRHVISLLSGHLGGANALARQLAGITGGEAIITTATDVNDLPAWDEVARKEGMGIEPVGNIRKLNSLLLRRGNIVLVDRSGRIAPYFRQIPGVAIAGTFAEAIRIGGAAKVFVTHRHIPGLESQDDLLVLRPKSLVVGIGCNRHTSAKEIEKAVLGELQEAFLSPASVACIATIDVKADEEGISLFAKRLNLPIEYHGAEVLNSVEAPGETSCHALAAVGAQGVCEPAAILSSGGGNLLVRKKKIGNVTVAVAERTR
jgi:cobalt-precorrin 5A hydrolase